MSREAGWQFCLDGHIYTSPHASVYGRHLLEIAKIKDHRIFDLDRGGVTVAPDEVVNLHLVIRSPMRRFGIIKNDINLDEMVSDTAPTDFHRIRVAVDVKAVTNSNPGERLPMLYGESGAAIDQEIIKRLRELGISDEMLVGRLIVITWEVESRVITLQPLVDALKLAREEGI